jgi:transcriptional regulator with XRE-family HTH domain
MNKRWPQQENFAARVKEFCKKNGLMTKRGAVKMDAAADLFDLNEDTLRQLLQDSTRKRPYIDTLINIASILGCSVTEFLDAPTDPPPGMSLEKWTALTARERMLASSLLAIIASDDLSIGEKEHLHNIFQAAKDSLLHLKKRADTL